MEHPSEILEQNAFNTRPRIEEHMFVVLDKIYSRREFISTITM